MIRKEMFWNISFNKPTAPHMVLDPRETEAKIQVLLLTRTSACTERYRSVNGQSCNREEENTMGTLSFYQAWGLGGE